ncbi:unnamed protein product [Aphanomyces euteiches]|uniref:EGF-like domain-containing protein n=1 Tax=Aphanomyces euteiches TaxID=100861 RepID=A0A6G0X8S9_9STRA|nr:hypothetical protein Ae201684_007406 [Aphanomyces euteiches]KAH9100583.1 hypothetical protein Ae201684P_006779 [Aphanomyces euteiches]KAH9144784.1 hypothetical protein AeRB84_011286 [Aphanomyces euteiches]
MKLASVLVATTALAAQTTNKPNATAKPNVTAETCKLQFLSPCKSDSQCGTLNGFNLTCIKSGSNMQCSCKGGAKKCQVGSTSDDVAYAFDACTESRRCVDGGGYKYLDDVALASGKPVCEEKLYCVQEQNNNTEGIVLTSQCLTCSSCRQMNTKSNSENGYARFDCDKICPTPPPTPAPTTTEAPETDAPTTRPSKLTTTASPTSTVSSGGTVPSGVAKSTAAASFMVGVVSVMAFALSLL